MVERVQAQREDGCNQKKWGERRNRKSLKTKVIMEKEEF
jgi:hypothetical protein